MGSVAPAAHLVTAGVAHVSWPPNSNLANLVIYGVFIKKSTFCHINGHPKQHILVDTIFFVFSPVDAVVTLLLSITKVHQWKLDLCKKKTTSEYQLNWQAGRQHVAPPQAAWLEDQLLHLSTSPQRRLSVRRLQANQTID